ncbi:hypothetical protein PR048_025819 [Dryococelus australis]|uniref:Uncharacterized protein n=1 Tax=Dryococelus australis TaxID=614101 RepID=A0ABQ9GJN4_9NEOP|nr:hypothetical protein PR048_025819 [Dryococelus australis]
MRAENGICMITIHERVCRMAASYHHPALRTSFISSERIVSTRITSFRLKTSSKHARILKVIVSQHYRQTQLVDLITKRVLSYVTNVPFYRGRGGIVDRLPPSHLGEPGSIPVGDIPGFSLVGILPDNAAGFFRDLPFPPPLHSDAAPYSSHFTIIGSQDLDVKIRPNISIPLTFTTEYHKLIVSFTTTCRIDSTVLCPLEPQMFAHWLLPHRAVSVTSHLAVWHSLLVSLKVCYWIRVVQVVSTKLRSNCKVSNEYLWDLFIGSCCLEYSETINPLCVQHVLKTGNYGCRGLLNTPLTTRSQLKSCKETTSEYHTARYAVTLTMGQQPINKHLRLECTLDCPPPNRSHRDKRIETRALLTVCGLNSCDCLKECSGPSRLPLSASLGVCRTFQIAPPGIFKPRRSSEPRVLRVESLERLCDLEHERLRGGGGGYSEATSQQSDEWRRERAEGVKSTTASISTVCRVRLTDGTVQLYAECKTLGIMLIDRPRYLQTPRVGVGDCESLSRGCRIKGNPASPTHPPESGSYGIILAHRRQVLFMKRSHVFRAIDQSGKIHSAGAQSSNTYRRFASPLILERRIASGMGDENAPRKPRPIAFSSTTPPGFEPGTPRWKASSLTTTPPRSCRCTISFNPLSSMQHCTVGNSDQSGKALRVDGIVTCSCPAWFPRILPQEYEAQLFTSIAGDQRSARTYSRAVVRSRARRVECLGIVAARAFFPCQRDSGPSGPSRLGYISPGVPLCREFGALHDDQLPVCSDMVVVTSDDSYRLFTCKKGATVAERLARWPPTKANWAQSPAGPPDFRMWESCRTMTLVSGFTRGSPASPAPPPQFRRCSIFTSIILIGSQALAKCSARKRVGSQLSNSQWRNYGWREYIEYSEVPHFLLLGPPVYHEKILRLVALQNTLFQNQHRVSMNLTRKHLRCLRPTKELYENTDTITDKFRKRRLQFYGHLCRMGEDRLTKKIFNIVNASQLKTNWMKETREDLERLEISEEEIKDRKKFRNLIRNKQKLNKNLKKKLWGEDRQSEGRKKNIEN